MTVIKRNALVSYSARQMFELVNHIEDYPRFLPWCRQAQILHQDEKVIEASLEIAWSGIHKSFTTRNHLTPFEKIEMKLVTGPFRHLDGTWQFIQLGDQGCKVCLDLEFELTGNIVDRVFQPIFNHIANSLVDAFCKRAVEIYGND